ncbi:hypothetical protein B0H14DRAFT_2740344 [Mycena olivaceomarginata]|nr:hypothetical protein B0H14DRAFT_2740344 [Mycena olivaceomarginata]
MSEPACASVLRLLRLLRSVSSDANGGRGGASSDSDTGRYAATRSGKIAFAAFPIVRWTSSFAGRLSRSVDPPCP